MIIMMKRKPLLINILLMVFSIIILFVILELIFSTQKISESFHQPDTILGWKGTPNHEGVFFRKEFMNKMQLNNFGSHDAKDYDEEKAEDSCRIILIGDSITEGAQVNVDKTFSHLLEKMLNGHYKINTSDNALKKVYETYNLGVSGYGTAQEFLMLKEFALKYKPDIVILGVAVLNDIRNNVFALDKDKTKPYAIIKNDNIEFTQFVVAKNTFLKGLAKKSNFIKHVNAMLLNIKKGYKIKYGMAANDYFIYNINRTAEYEEGFEITKRLILEMDKIIKEKDIKLIIVFFHTKEVVDNELWNQIIKEYKIKKYEADLEMPFNEFEAFCNENNLICINTLREARKIEPVPTDLHYPIDGHLNKKGHRFIAELLYNKIIDDELGCVNQKNIEEKKEELDFIV